MTQILPAVVSPTGNVLEDRAGALACGAPVWSRPNSVPGGCQLHPAQARRLVTVARATVLETRSSRTSPAAPSQGSSRTPDGTGQVEAWMLA
jgi:hypothetical protein